MEMHRRRVLAHWGRFRITGGFSYPTILEEYTTDSMDQPSWQKCSQSFRDIALDALAEAIIKGESIALATDAILPLPKEGASNENK